MLAISGEGPDGSFMLSLEQSSIALGRGNTCEVVLASKQISRNHARIDVIDGRVMLTDLGSGNGTHVDEQRIEGSVEVSPDAVIQLGPFALRVQWLDAPASIEPSQPRTFVCPDRVWDELAAWARERGEAVDALVVEALADYARARSPGGEDAAHRGALATLPGNDAPPRVVPPPLPNLAAERAPDAVPPPLPGAAPPANATPQLATATPLVAAPAAPAPKVGPSAAPPQPPRPGAGPPAPPRRPPPPPRPAPPPVRPPADASVQPRAMGAAPPNLVTIGATPPNVVLMGATPPNVVLMGATPPNVVLMGATPPNVVLMGATPPNVVLMGATPPNPRAPSALDRAVSRARSATPAGDAVDCSVFAPPVAPIGGSFAVEVALHGPEHARAGATASAAVLELDVPRDATLVVTLALPPGLSVEPLRLVRWQGRAELLRFDVAAQPGLAAGPVDGKVIVSVGDVPVGHVALRIELAELSADQVPAAIGQGAPVRYRRAFASYETVDRSEVAKRTQSLRQAGVQVREEMLVLEPRQRWEHGLYGEIDQCDLFLLFWSTAASTSEWVMREVWHALQRKREGAAAPPEIVPIVLEQPPIPTPPEWLAHLAFGERLLVANRVRGA